MRDIKASSEVRAKTFRALYCEVYRCRPEDFTRKMLWRSLHLRALPLALLIRMVRPRFFNLDLQLLEEVGNAEGPKDFLAAINGFRQDCQTNNGFLHEDMRIRVSGKRLLSVFKKTKLKAQAAGKFQP